MHRVKATVVLLAGGKGSRSANPAIPKILQTLDDSKTLLHHWLELLENQGFEKAILIGGHGIDLVMRAIEGIRTKIKVELIEDVHLAGTLSALRLVHTNDPSYLVLTGDTYSTLNYARYHERWEELRTDSALLVHKNNHLVDSDSVSFEEGYDSPRIRVKGSSVPRGTESWALTGAAFFSKEALTKLQSLTNLTEIFAGVRELNSKMSMSVITVAGASMDSGTAERLSRVRESYRYSKRCDGKRLAVFLDRDETLIPDLPRGRKRLHASGIKKDDAKMIGRLNYLGIPVFVVTNQPAVAKGWISKSQVMRVHLRLQEILSLSSSWIDGFGTCFHHPDRGFTGEILELKVKCDCRKPMPGLGQSLIALHGLDDATLFVVGDSAADQGFASALGAEFLSAKYGTSQGVARAIERILEWRS